MPGDYLLVMSHMMVLFFFDFFSTFSICHNSRNSSIPDLLIDVMSTGHVLLTYQVLQQSTFSSSHTIHANLPSSTPGTLSSCIFYWHGKQCLRRLCTAHRCYKCQQTLHAYSHMHTSRLLHTTFTYAASCIFSNLYPSSQCWPFLGPPWGILGQICLYWGKFALLGWSRPNPN